jgi:DNA-binding response OmpR family regulator
MATKPRILLVEDDLALATAYRVRMEAEGFEVKHCPNGEEALQTALEYHPDLIVLDIMMPKISGFDVLDILRNTKQTAHTKIVILTALSQPSDRQRAKDLGADEFLVKSQAVIADVMKRIRFHLGIKEPETSR